MIRFARKIIASTVYIAYYMVVLVVLGAVALCYGIVSGVAHIWGTD